MPKSNEIHYWVKYIQTRYVNYLKTSFHFKDPDLRKSFERALKNSGELIKGPFEEPVKRYKEGMNELELVDRYFSGDKDNLYPLFEDRPLWIHQQNSIEATFHNERNIVVATGTASGKTESFLYPIFLSLYSQHCLGQLNEPGVRALILYPMNALANDQRQRLGEFCRKLQNQGSNFHPTFGQYTGQTPKHPRDINRNAEKRKSERLPNELVFREEMRATPPHILLTNYSMLEYLLIRPDDHQLFDGGNGRFWQFIVLDEAHQYRGTKGMEMGMLIRRLKQRLREGGRERPFQCIATSATIASDSDSDKEAVAAFASELFGEKFTMDGIVFPEFEDTTITEQSQANSSEVGRYHVFVRSLEGAFLIQHDNNDEVVLNRKITENDSKPLEIALCRECGQHYYVGKLRNGFLEEPMRDPNHDDFGVDYYLPIESNFVNTTHHLCKSCGKISESFPECNCNATIPVVKCESREDEPDQLKKCEVCEYSRGTYGDPVTEIVYGSDGPNAVIVTALHELLSENRRKILAFTDSRQEAAFFAWYSEKSYQDFRDRNLLLRAVRAYEIDAEGLSIEDLHHRLYQQWEDNNLFQSSESKETRAREVMKYVLSEAVSTEKRLSLAGVGLIKWFVKLPESFQIPEPMMRGPWNFDKAEAHAIICYLLDLLRTTGTLKVPKNSTMPKWADVSPYHQKVPNMVCWGKPRTRSSVRQWGSERSSVVNHYLIRLLEKTKLPDSERKKEAIKLMKLVWDAIRSHDEQNPNSEPILVRAEKDGTFRLNMAWLRLSSVDEEELYECDTCGTTTSFNIRNVCTRNYCPGCLIRVNKENLRHNHYRIVYENPNFPVEFKAEEHTAQIDSDVAQDKQNSFKTGDIHLLSSSTTFEVGVDLGDLEVVFLRNVPPESFNYIQRVGRAGRRETPGLAVTYCRRNPHDLYHYEDPEERIIRGTIRPPQLQLKNEKIVTRHIVAVALSAFFRSRNNGQRIKNVEEFIGDWNNPTAVSDMKEFCTGNKALRNTLKNIVPHALSVLRKSLDNDDWISLFAESKSRLFHVQEEICRDYQYLENIEREYSTNRKHFLAGSAQKRMETIASENTISFLSKKAVIPKYGFPVDVVELETYSGSHSSVAQVSLRRDLSLAISEYAPGGIVIANKKEWTSTGLKVFPDKELPKQSYEYDGKALNFKQSTDLNKYAKKYISPIYGFVTPFSDEPKEPRRRVQKMYTTRPFFDGFHNRTQSGRSEINEPAFIEILGVKVMQVVPGKLINLCEGRNKRGFYICDTCGSHHTEKRAFHKSPANSNCSGRLTQYSLGHELVTDVLRIQFPNLHNLWEAYSLAYAVLLGAAVTLEVPNNDLDVTVTKKYTPHQIEIILYDNVPGGAGLVARFYREVEFIEMLTKSKERVSGKCGCSKSCYGCLRSFRNQFAHPHLERITALEKLNSILMQKI